MPTSRRAGGPDAGEVEPPALAGHPTVKDRGTIRPVEQQVPVVAPARRMPGVEVAGDLAGFDHRHPGAEIRVRTPPPSVFAADRFRVEVRHLPQRMHPGVGAARADDPYGLVGDPGERPLDSRLDGLAVRLTFPSAEPPSVVFDDEGYPAGSHPGAGIPGRVLTPADRAPIGRTRRRPPAGRPLPRGR